MIHLQIPRNSLNLYKHIDCLYEMRLVPPPGFEDNQEEFPKPIISQSLSKYLYDIKERIDIYEREWDIYKRYTNPYEYIHTIVPVIPAKSDEPFSGNIPKYKSVSKYKPLSRSYFKMIEISNLFRLLDDLPSDKINTFHLAEGPGGFIEALVNMRENKNDEYIGMTILDDVYDPNIPAWKKSEKFLKENATVKIENGYDGTGDILSIANFEYCVGKYGSKMDIITGDGGFDFSSDFNNQEVHIARLLFAQMAFAICMQKRGGSFVLKLFDCFMQHTIDILAILSSVYDKVYITKPQTSRYANSEKYVVCKGFLHESCVDIYPYLRDIFGKMNALSATMTHEPRIVRFLNIPLANFFITRIEELNAIFGQQQIEVIHNTILLMDSKNKTDKISALVRSNVEKCIHWCAKHNIPHQ